MNRWTFTGRIHPERVPVSTQRVSFDNSFGDGELDYHAVLDIAQSQIVANITISRGQPDIETLRNSVEGCVRTQIDLVGYFFGGSFDVEIVSARNDVTGQTIIFGITIPVLQSTRRLPLEIPTNLIAAVGATMEAQAILANFREAMRVPVDSGFFCYRSIEGMLYSVVSIADQARAGDWAKFRETLKVAQSALTFVKSHADLPRHGRISSITDQERSRVFRVTDEVIRRYLHWLVHGQTPLDIKMFPLLVEQ